MTTSQSKIPLTYRGAILLASADLPAVRKLRGFKRHSAHRGCSKCFPRNLGHKSDYSGFDRELWTPRQNESHRLHTEMVRKASTLKRHDDLAREYGVYYSSLLKLEYFDVVRFTAIDPMHNLFL